ncbi:TonB-dependent receptor [Pseudobacteriovorax antillogorgiicola]|uniref:Iron complex outermembrane recepter protein n=1 Tax=Pseudobacteriovorax antillogorgiicola TaxID=1513793 RepID=A0A1Y6CQ18_9BACT|nr:TonB-dependent receptor [Pseudobacteriovorax antillogorgiicola]TCS46983.1 iron complex outermembrane receptor protein [Pseudobacteriovorax antillogorgiicola]SMF64826.1 iron complex outermembrane recepter protein [Pseudobacteriovorax antillogorgiicola]
MLYRRIAKSLILGSPLVFSGTLFGQEGESGEKAERIQVTGSRIKRMDMEGSSPITVIDRQAIEISGSQTVTDVLKTLPAVVGNSVTTSTTNGGGGGAGNITLRGLPATATLVLLNGRRLPNDGLAGETPDLNAIPVAAIERIEVLKDGASAVYGSDAIAGVVNIITKKDFTGTSVDVYAGAASEGDLETTSVSVTYGAASDKGNIMIGVNHYRQGNVRSADRDVSSYPLGGGSSAIPNGSAVVTTAGSGFTCADGEESCRVTVRDGVTEITGVGDFREVSGDEYNYSELTDAIMAQERRSVYLYGNYDISDTVRANLTSTYTNTLSNYQSAPTPIFTAFETGSLTMAADNEFNPFGEALTDVRRRMTDFGPRQSTFDSNVTNLVLGLEGDLLDIGWGWNFDYNYGNTKTIETAENLVNKANFTASISSPAVCDALEELGCVPVNMFGPDGSLSAEQIAWLKTEANIRGEADTESFVFNIGGEIGSLPGGPISIAGGLEYRREAIKFRPDGQTSSFNSIGNTNFKPTSGDREVSEAYLEALLPVVKMVDVELAARYSSYDDFGNTFNPKVGLKFKPVQDFILRGTYSTGFRAPSLRELYQGEAENFAFLNDPCASDASKCNGGPQSDSSLFQFLALEGGNEDLDPEESTSYTFGLAYSPSWGLNVKADYFFVETKNAIDINPQFIVDQYRNNGLFSDKIVLDSNNNIRTIQATALNLAARKVKGVDFGVDYTTRFGTDRFGVALTGTKFLEYLNQADKSSDFVDVVGKFVDAASEGVGSIPDHKLNLGFSYGVGGFTLNLTNNYTSKLEAEGSDLDKDFEAWLTHDVQATYTVTSWATTFTLGADNITNKEPPSSDAAFNDNIDARTHNLIGSFYYASVSTEL